MSIICKLLGHKSTMDDSRVVLDGLVSKYSHVLVSMACSRCGTPIILGHLNRPPVWSSSPEPIQDTVTCLSENARLRMARELRDAADALLGDDCEYVSGGLRMSRDADGTRKLISDLAFKGTGATKYPVLHDEVNITTPDDKIVK